MNDRVKGAGGIHLCRKLFGLPDTTQIARNDTRRSRHLVEGLHPPLLVAGVQQDLMPLANQFPCRQLAQSIRRPGNEYSRHIDQVLSTGSPLTYLDYSGKAGVSVSFNIR
jgi:hypothetical protein